MSMIKVMIVDDHPLVWEGLKKVVSKGSMDIEVAYEASNAAEMQEMLSKQLPDIVILDIAMPGRSGMDVLKDIKNLYSQLPVLMLSMHPEDRFAVRAMKAGASGYMTKTSISDELVKAIRTIVTLRKRYISPEVAEQLALQIDSSGNKSLHETLSDREYQILCMIASGKKIGDIAEELSLSVQTIHTYRARLKDKMNMKSNVELARYAIQQDLID
ncbi:MAG: response regulator transcription factor [Balneolaceae bacterium]